MRWEQEVFTQHTAAIGTVTGTAAWPTPACASRKQQGMVRVPSCQARLCLSLSITSCTVSSMGCVGPTPGSGTNSVQLVMTRSPALTALFAVVAAAAAATGRDLLTSRSTADQTCHVQGGAYVRSNESESIVLHCAHHVAGWQRFLDWKHGCMHACMQESKIPGPDQISTTCQSEELS